MIILPEPAEPAKPTPRHDPDADQLASESRVKILMTANVIGVQMMNVQLRNVTSPRQPTTRGRKWQDVCVPTSDIYKVCMYMW